MGVHTGEALESSGDYVGLAVHQARGSWRPGTAARSWCPRPPGGWYRHCPTGVELRDLGEQRLKDLAAPERLYQLVIDGPRRQFPPLRTLDARANNLPVQLTSFVGRAELAAAREALGETRIC